MYVNTKAMEWLEILQKIGASIFIVLMSILLLFWCLPEGYFFRELLHKHFGKAICWAGLDNYWALFAPQPVSKNFLIGFEIEFRDGTIQAWKLPEYTLKNDYQWAPHFRFIKMHNQLLSQKDTIPKEAICKYILKEFQKTNVTVKSPIKIHILRFYEPADERQRSLFPWLSQRVFTHTITSST